MSVCILTTYLPTDREKLAHWRCPSEPQFSTCSIFRCQPLLFSGYLRFHICYHRRQQPFAFLLSSGIEVEAPRLFDRMARRFNVDYAFYKTGPDKYLLFFKAGQADAVTACFESYSRKLLTQSKSKRIPIREQLKQAAERLAVEKPRAKERVKEAAREDR